MNAVIPLHSAESIRRHGNTYRAMLEDTRDLLGMLRYESDEDKKAADIQIEAINQVLTGDLKAG